MTNLAAILSVIAIASAPLAQGATVTSPSDWGDEARCEYIADYIRILDKHDIEATQTDMEDLISQSSGCDIPPALALYAQPEPTPFAPVILGGVGLALAASTIWIIRNRVSRRDTKSGASA